MVLNLRIILYWQIWTSSDKYWQTLTDTDKYWLILTNTDKYYTEPKITPKPYQYYIPNTTSTYRYPIEDLYPTNLQTVAEDRQDTSIIFGVPVANFGVSWSLLESVNRKTEFQVWVMGWTQVERGFSTIWMIFQVRVCRRSA